MQTAIPAESAAAYRIGFGLLVAFSSLRFLAKGWVDTLYLAPENHLTFAGADWVRPLPAPWMHFYVLGLAGLGLCIAAGFHYRIAIVAFTLGFTYVEFIEASLYLNHYWYVTLAAALMCVLPLHHCWSLDARSGRVASRNTVPALVVWSLRAQLAIVYLFAGLAKLNPDWLFEAQPLRLWLAAKSELPVVGPILAEPATAYFASWAGMLFDCTIVLWLLMPATRRFAYLAVVAFHLVTWMLFPIGVFPWVMMISALIFFEPDWPSRVADRLAQQRLPRPEFSGEVRVRPWLMVVLAAFAVFQLALPIRHYFYAGNVRWNEQGYYGSWRVMLTEKAGFVEYRVTDPLHGTQWVASPELVLADWQMSQAAIRPGLIHATAYLLAEHYALRGMTDLQIRADAFVSFNGEPSQRMIDPDSDLLEAPRGRMPAQWILPLDPA